MTVYPLRFLSQKRGKNVCPPHSYSTLYARFYIKQYSKKNIIKGIHIKKEKVKLSIFTTYVKNPIETTETLLIDKAAGHKINIQKPTVPCKCIIKNKY